MNIRHVGLVVKDLNSSLKFWRGLLGFKILKRNEENGEAIDNILKIKNCRITTVKLTDKNKNILELIKFKNQKYQTRRAIFTHSNGFTHIALTIKNLDQLYNKLKKKIIFNCPPQISKDKKVKLTYLKTPEGAFLELVEELK
jgi:catechol-2,3-dioxygenase